MNKPLFNKICIVGVGLIGGSLGLAIKKRRLAKFVVGVARRKSSAIEAVGRKAVDMATLDLKEGVRAADLIILAGPIPTIISQIKTLSNYVSPNSVIMDVGSSKAQIGLAAKQFLKKNVFIGCHPMTGSEKCGIEFADENLFRDAICFLMRKNKIIEVFWKSLGSKPIVINETDHDAWVAKSSHLPHALSFSLFQNIESQFPYNPSLKDLARLAGSHAELWVDILLSNQEQVLKAASEFQKDFSRLKKALRTKNRNALVRFILHANQQTSSAGRRRRTGR